MTDPIISNDFISKMTRFARDLELQDTDLTYQTLDTSVYCYLHEEYCELEKATGAEDDIEILDGAGDVAFIALNIIYKWGRLKGKSHGEASNLVSEVMNRICDSNLTKILPDGSVLRNDEGKVLKPDSFKPVDLKDLV